MPVADTAAKRSFCESHLHAYIQAREKLPVARGSGSKFIDDYILPKYLDQFPCYVAHKVIRKALCNWFEAQMRKSTQWSKAKQKVTIKIPLKPRKPRRRPAKEIFAQAIQKRLKEETQEELGRQMLNSSERLKVRSIVLDRIWEKEDSETKQYYVEMAENDDLFSKKTPSPENSINEQISFLDECIPPVLKHFQQRLPDWCFDLRMGGKDASGKVIFRRYDLAPEGCQTYQDHVKSQDSVFNMSLVCHFQEYLEVQKWRHTLVKPGNDGYPRLQKSHVEWTPAVYAEALSIYMTQTWEIAFGTSYIAWDEVVGRSEQLKTGSLPQNFALKRISDYENWEVLAIHQHIFDTQDNSSSRFAWKSKKQRVVNVVSDSEDQKVESSHAQTAICQPHYESSATSETTTLELQGREAAALQPSTASSTRSRIQKVEYQDVQVPVSQLCLEASSKGKDQKIKLQEDQAAIRQRHSRSSDRDDNQRREPQNEQVTLRQPRSKSSRKHENQKIKIQDGEAAIRQPRSKSSNRGDTQKTEPQDEQIVLRQPRSRSLTPINPVKVESQNSQASLVQSLSIPEWSGTSSTCQGGTRCQAFTPKWAVSSLDKYDELNTYWKKSSRWFKASMNVLRDIGQQDCPAWRAMLTYVIVAEHELPMGRLPTNSLPKDPLDWTSDMRVPKYPSKDRVATFTKEWVDWWLSLHPGRQRRIPNQQADLSHEQLNAQSKRLLAKSGPSGMFNVVYGLALCYPRFKSATTTSGILTLLEWHSYVYDVIWVYEQLLSDRDAYNGLGRSQEH